MLLRLLMEMWEHIRGHNSLLIFIITKKERILKKIRKQAFKEAGNVSKDFWGILCVQLIYYSMYYITNFRVKVEEIKTEYKFLN